MATYAGTLHEEPEAAHAELEHTIAVHGGWFHEYADILTEGVSPGIASVVVLTPTSIRVTFERPALKNEALSSADNYRITPSLGVHAVTVPAGLVAAYVDLTIDEQKTGEAYTLELLRIEAA